MTAVAAPARVLGLVRVSTDAQELDRQVIALRSWAEKQGVADLDIREEKRSGRAKVRPVLDAILAECRAGRVGCLVVAESARLSRSLARTIELLEELERLKVRVVILSLGWDFNPHSTAGKFLIRQLALVSELLLDLTRDATIEALDGDVIEGKRHSIYGAKLGRPGVTLSTEALSAARQQREAGVPMSEIVRSFPPGRRRYKAADGSWEEGEHPVSAGMLWRALRG